MTVNDIVSGTRDLYKSGKVSDEVAKFVEVMDSQSTTVLEIR